MSSQHIAIRVDASHEIGTGHFMRCLTLADALNQHNAQVTFVSRHLPEYLADTLTEKGHHLIMLKNDFNTKTIGDLAHSHWLGASQQSDAMECIQLLGHQQWDWLIVDHYALDARWELALKTLIKKVMVIDDLADRQHDCDVLLDQNFFLNLKERYTHKIPSNCIALLGPSYALLQPLYAKLHQSLVLKSTPIRRIFIFFGGVDNENLTSKTIDAFQKLKCTDITLDIVMTDKSPHFTSIKEQIGEDSNICLHSTMPTLAPLMYKADLAIGAGGATTWERLCLGLPSIVISIADNQKNVSTHLANAGLIKYLGSHKKVTAEEIYQALLLLIQTPSLSSWSAKCFEMCDGQGTLRVVDQLLLPTTKVPL